MFSSTNLHYFIKLLFGCPRPKVKTDFNIYSYSQIYELLPFDKLLIITYKIQSWSKKLNDRVLRHLQNSIKYFEIILDITSRKVYSI